MTKRKRPRCSYYLPTGHQCPRRAASGSALCTQHRPAPSQTPKAASPGPKAPSKAPDAVPTPPKGADIAIAKPGRPTTLTPEVHQKIVEAVMAGVPIAIAALMQGISNRTVEDWLARGRGTDDRAPESPWLEFAVDVDKARAQSKAARIANIRAIARGGQVVGRRTTRRHGKGGEVLSETVEETYSMPQWTADAWWLERQDSDEFGKVSTLRTPDLPGGGDWFKALAAAAERSRDPRVIDITPPAKRLPEGKR